jgi:hypothetical protein
MRVYAAQPSEELGIVLGVITGLALLFVFVRLIVRMGRGIREEVSGEPRPPKSKRRRRR